MNWKEHLLCWCTVLRTIRRNYLGKRLEPECSVLKYFISEGSICFDVGAAQGRYTLAMARLAGSGHVYSFEPGDYFYHVLLAIRAFYRLKNVSLIKAACGEKSGSGYLTIPLKKNKRVGYSLAYLSSLAHNKQMFCQDVKVVALDDFCAEAGIEKIDFMKCDVEGAELCVFQGARRMIEKSKPVILCELCEDFLGRFNCSLKQVENFFTALGYRAYVLSETLIPVERLSRTGNFFFLPEAFSLPETGGR